jgi:hypothetical protein
MTSQITALLIISSALEPKTLLIENNHNYQEKYMFITDVFKSAFREVKFLFGENSAYKILSQPSLCDNYM